MADFGPLMQSAMRFFGLGSSTPERQGAPAQPDESWKTPARQMFPSFNPNRRPVQIEEALGNAPIAPASAQRQGGMSPEQQADWQAVGLGQMKISEFRAKHGFLPQ